jgi:Holliday junction resolvase RusA-like endonuclease
MKNNNNVQFFVDGNPIPKQSYRARNGGGGYTAPHVKAWAKLVSDVARISMMGRDMYEGGVSVELTFFLPNNRRKDWDNLAKNVMDAMNGIVYKDDSQVTMATIIKTYDKDDPGVYVFVEKDLMEMT